MLQAAIVESPASAVVASRREWRLDVRAGAAEAEPLQVAATLVEPGAGAPRALLACLPGGFLGRSYFDLAVDGDRRFSFAEAMAEHGFATLALDPLGVGDSSRPRNGWALDAETLAGASQCALRAALERLQRERSAPATLPVLGVGHSMGSCQAVVQQAEHAPFVGLVLFSFTTGGLPAFLEGSEPEVANDRAAIRSRIVELARPALRAALPGRRSGRGPPRLRHRHGGAGRPTRARARQVRRAAHPWPALDDPREAMHPGRSACSFRRSSRSATTICP